jgi:predicted dehydrogenase
LVIKIAITTMERVMSNPTRREFVRNAAIGVTAAMAWNGRSAFASSPNERVRLGIIGCGNQGGQHLKTLVGAPDAEIVCVSDLDTERLAKAVAESGGAKGHADFRKVLDDVSVDAVIVATPDHWHAPAAIMALDAGKHVYVEKPFSHNVREAQLLLDATKRSGKVVAHGTQSRSNPAIQQAMKMLRDGVIGDVLVAKCWDCQKRDDIGHKQPSTAPANINYDAWVGPAKWMPYQENRHHYNWHWWHNFGCGDIGNDGIHEIDYALWGMGIETHPTIITGGGGKYFFDDDQEFPDTQQVTFEYPGDDKVGSRRMLTFEQRLWTTNYPFGVDSGVEYFGTEGRMFVSKRGKFDLIGPRNRRLDVKLDSVPMCDITENHRNWLACIKSGGVPHANAEVASRAAIAVHLGNIATRLQRTIRFDAASQQIAGDDEANALIAREYRDGGHWGIPNGAV